MKRQIQAWLTVAMMVWTAVSARAATINVDLNYGSGPTFSGTAAAPDSGTTWNGVTVATAWPTLGTTTSGALVDSTNAVSPVSFSLSNVGGYDAGSASVASELMRDFAA
ncbi:MAG: hypothetical protein PHR35_06830, partial [Kiritimatiellae bacterium]|nr:hypothetical protein [Kiritimatiellia bacterium]